MASCMLSKGEVSLLYIDSIIYRQFRSTSVLLYLFQCCLNHLKHSSDSNNSQSLCSLYCSTENIWMTCAGLKPAIFLVSWGLCVQHLSVRGDGDESLSGRKRRLSVFSEGRTRTWMCVFAFKPTFSTSRTVSTSTAVFILGKSKPSPSSAVKTQAYVETLYSTQTRLHTPAFPRCVCRCSHGDAFFPKKKLLESRMKRQAMLLVVCVVYWSKPSWAKQPILWFAYRNTDSVICCICMPSVLSGLSFNRGYWLPKKTVIKGGLNWEVFNEDSPFSLVRMTTAPAFTSLSRASVCK